VRRKLGGCVSAGGTGLRCRATAPLCSHGQPCGASVGGADREVGSLPLLTMLKWLRLIHDVVIVIVIVTDGMMSKGARVTVAIGTSGVTGGGRVGKVRIGDRGMGDMRAGNGEENEKHEEMRRRGK